MVFCKMRLMMFYSILINNLIYNKYLSNIHPPPALGGSKRKMLFSYKKNFNFIIYCKIVSFKNQKPTRKYPVKYLYQAL